MGAVETIIDTVTDNKKYYNCPGCGDEVWAYGSFVGNTCWNCPGTFGDAILRTADVITQVPIASTTKDLIFDNKIEYRCQRCGVKKWAYGGGVGRVCLDCRNKGWGNDKYDNWYDIDNAADSTKSLDTILDYYYDSSGKSVTIQGETFNNMTPKYKLAKTKNYKEINTSYCCGNNAINMCLKIHGYNKQLTDSQYKHDKICGVECGYTYKEFYEKNIENNFTYHSWKGNKGYLKDPKMQWDYLNATDFSEYSLIIMGGDGVGHYTIVLGVNTRRTHYLVSDQSKKVWLVDASLMRKMCTYGLSKSQGTIGINAYNECSMFRVG
eukprot:225437_1